MEWLRTVRDTIVYHERPKSWSDWRRMIIVARQTGIVRDKAPKVFYMSQALLDVFDEMLPVKNGHVDITKQSVAVQKALNHLEVARALVVDSLGESLLVQTINDGNSKLTSRGSSVSIIRKANHLGSIHTHTIDDMPSSPDVGNILSGNNLISIIVTPIRTIAMLRSSETPTFPIKTVLEGYLTAMGISKGRIKERSLDPEENFWTVHYPDLSQLRILGYEANRGKRAFVKMTD